MRVSAFMFAVATISSAYAQSTYQARLTGVVTTVDNFLEKKLGHDTEFKRFIKDRLAHDNFYDRQAFNWMPKGEVERQVELNYVKKYGPEVINPRINFEYNRFTQEVVRYFRSEVQDTKNYENQLRRDFDFEVLCGTFCSRQKLAAVTNKAIENYIQRINQRNAIASSSTDNENRNSGQGRNVYQSVTESPVRTTSNPVNTAPQTHGRLEWVRDAYGGWVQRYVYYSAGNERSSNMKPATEAPTQPLQFTQRITQPIIKNSIQSATSSSNEDEDSYNILQNNLQLWYPRMTFLHQSLFDDLKRRQFHRIPNFSEITSNQALFEASSISILNEQIYQGKVTQEVIHQAREFLRRNYPGMANNLLGSTIAKFVRDNNNTFDAEIMFSSEKLRTKLVPATDNAVNDYKNLESSLESWFPNSNELVEKFISYLKERNPSSVEMQSFEDRNFFLSQQNRYLRDFKNANHELVKTAIKNETIAVLNSVDPEKVPRNFEILSIKKPDLLNNLTNFDTLRTQISGFIVPIKNCISNLQHRIESALVSITQNSEELDELKEHFQSNKCVADEICVKTNGKDSSFMLELKPYVDAYRKSQGDSVKGNVNIKDEIDESVYDVIQNHLEHKKNVDAGQPECFVDYLRRTNDLDAVYSSYLLFNEELLLKNIEPFVEKYENDYIRLFYKKIE